MLCPNNKQRTKFFENAGVVRFTYNWALNYQQINYDIGNDFLTDVELNKILARLKKTHPDFIWLNNFSNKIAKQAVKDACNAYVKFFKGEANFPRFKSKKKSRPSFYIDPSKVQFSTTHVKMEKLVKTKKRNRQIFNWVRLAEENRIPLAQKYFNPRVTYDGLNWWISVGVEWDENTENNYQDGMGIDLGIKELAICSDGARYANINKTLKIKTIQRRIKRKQRKISKKYNKNKKGICYYKTNNIAKEEKRLLKLFHKLTNIHHNYIHQITTEITHRKPRFVVMENLDLQNMTKNKRLAKKIHEQHFHEFRRQMEYKCKWNNIEFILADKYYPSSKKCCCCGYIKKDLKLFDRIYTCPKCGNIIDRDFQASVNLMHYGLMNIKTNN